MKVHDRACGDLHNVMYALPGGTKAASEGEDTEQAVL
jgi:hypothetical protein